MVIVAVSMGFLAGTAVLWLMLRRRSASRPQAPERAAVLAPPVTDEPPSRVAEPVEESLGPSRATAELAPDVPAASDSMPPSPPDTIVAGAAARLRENVNDSYAAMNGEGSPAGLESLPSTPTDTALLAVPEPGLPPRTKVAVPRKYKSAQRGGPKRPSKERQASGKERERALGIDVRARLERGGFCRVSLLPRRGRSLPEEIVITGTGGDRELSAMQEEWYQDVEPEGLGGLLENGVAWSGVIAGAGTVRWSLSGREIYVLAPREELSGFLLAPRLLLGENHIVLCKADRLAEVRDALQAAGAEGPVALEWSAGASRGWAALGAVRPTIPVTPSGNGEIFDALRPIPNARIELGGGIRIARSTWLAGFPPVIRILGDTTSAGTVYIDGVASTPDGAGVHEVAGWDSLGEHGVTCLCGTRTYRIAAGLEAWQPWDAYTWSTGDASSQQGRRPAVCGLLVQPPLERRSESRLFTTGTSNALLIGPVPGQVYACENRLDLRARTCAGYPHFEPVWALPSNPLHCDKSSTRVLRVGSAIPFPADAKRRNRTQEQSLLAWARAVLDAARKGLLVEPGDEDTAALWLEYQRVARVIWRAVR